MLNLCAAVRYFLRQRHEGINILGLAQAFPYCPCRLKCALALPINATVNFNTMYFANNDDNAFSYHTGGAQFLLADGSARLISENIAIEILCNLYSIKDGNTLGEF